MGAGAERRHRESATQLKAPPWADPVFVRRGPPGELSRINSAEGKRATEVGG